MKGNNLNVFAKLIKSGVDAIYVYERVVPKINNEIMKHRLAEFYNTHKEHVRELTAIMGNTESVGSNSHGLQDLKSAFLKGLSVLQSRMGMKNALRSLRSVEEITNQRYSDIVSQELPQDDHDLLRRHFTDVKIHLDYISNNLEAMS